MVESFCLIYFIYTNFTDDNNISNKHKVKLAAMDTVWPIVRTQTHKQTHIYSKLCERPYSLVLAFAIDDLCFYDWSNISGFL